MKSFIVENIKVVVCEDVMEYANLPVKPFGELPEDAEPDDRNPNCTGICSLEDREIYLHVGPKCEFEDLLEVVSHELGHIVEGGWEENPPDEDAYILDHEMKADHYQNFTMTAYLVTKRILNGDFDDMDWFEPKTRLVPAIPPEDYEGSVAEWMITLQEWGLWDGEGFHGDVLIPSDVWVSLLDKCENQ